MVGALRRVLVCAPRSAGWDSPERKSRWRELGFLHEPEGKVAEAHHETMCHQLEAAGAEVFHLPAAGDLSLDAIYTHDASFATDRGIVVLSLIHI